jgi:hypothetical protein
MLNLKTNTFAFIFLLGASLANSIVFLGDNSFVSFFVGELIIIAFVYDLAKTNYKFHIYQVLLCYFYYTLCLTHSFSGFFLKSDYYTWAYVISLTHFIFFAIGYNSIKYKHGTLTFFPRQNMIVLAYILFVLVSTLVSIKFEGTGAQYTDKFSPSAEEVRDNISVVTYAYRSIIANITTISLLIFSNPFVFGVYSLLSGFNSYIGSGIKAGVFVPCVSFLLIYQVYYKKITTKQMLILLPIGFFVVTFLIGTTAFRGDLSLKSLLSLEATTIYSSAQEFLTGPESSHIIYTADIIEKIDKGETTYRYGFDFYRFILYPFRTLIDNFGYASYVEYAALRAGKLINGGRYLGLAGELYWNFGIFFFVFSYLMGYALKCFTNYAFSLKPFGVITYLTLMHVVIWRYYRGAVSDIMFHGSLFFVSGIVFFALMKLFGVKFPPFGRKLVKDLM